MERCRFNIVTFHLPVHCFEHFPDLFTSWCIRVWRACSPPQPQASYKMSYGRIYNNWGLSISQILIMIHSIFSIQHGVDGSYLNIVGPTILWYLLTRFPEDNRFFARMATQLLFKNKFNYLMFQIVLLLNTKLKNELVATRKFNIFYWYLRVYF